MRNYCIKDDDTTWLEIVLGEQINIHTPSTSNVLFSLQLLVRKNYCNLLAYYCLKVSLIVDTKVSKLIIYPYKCVMETVAVTERNCLFANRLFNDIFHMITFIL